MQHALTPHDGFGVGVVNHKPVPLVMRVVKRLFGPAGEEIVDDFPRWVWVGTTFSGLLAPHWRDDARAHRASARLTPSPSRARTG